MSASNRSLPTSPLRPTSAPPPVLSNPTPQTSSPFANSHRPHRPSPLTVRPDLLSSSQSSADAPSSSKTLQSALSRGSTEKARVLGIQKKLKTEIDGVVKRRAGGVLARGFILKTDHYPTGRALDLDLTIQGAPNFRAPDEEGLNVFGVRYVDTLAGNGNFSNRPQVHPHHPRLSTDTTSKSSLAPGVYTARSWAQQRTSGWHAHRARAHESCFFLAKEGQATIDRGQRERDLVQYTGGDVDILVNKAARLVRQLIVNSNGRPYVLRDASNPFQTLTLSDRATNLEDIERRLKLDILDEARRYGGMVLIHDEISSGEIIPTWMSVDEESIRTPKEVYEDVEKEGWNVTYWRIPIAPDRPIEDNYLDAYVSVLRDVDPLTTSLVFNCGMGVVRTTFGMCAALLVRRKQFLLQSLDDPISSTPSASVITTPAPEAQAAQFFEQTTHQQALNKSLLRMTRVLERNLPSKHPSTAIDLLASQPGLLEQLRKAHMGNYQIVMSLLSNLDHGRQMKGLVDAIIDTCDAVVNLRENVIENRIRYSISAMDDKTRQSLLAKALRSLEQYFDLIVFAEYVEKEEAGATGVTFSTWLKSRPEIWNQIKILRRQGGDRLFAFAPVDNLRLISRSSDYVDGQHRRFLSAENHNMDIDLQGEKVLGDEWAEHVVKNRNGIMLRASTLLKSDLWLSESATSSEGVRGA
ncbi:MAG: hypothetical protein TREMPRED_004663, partial [Tremellales sp. Tagirdzhanova-0007]